MPGLIPLNEPASGSGKEPRARVASAAASYSQSAAVSCLRDQPQQPPSQIGNLNYRRVLQRPESSLTHVFAGRAISVFLLAAVSLSAAPAVDIATVAPDLTVPKMEKSSPAPGKRVRQTHPDYADTQVHHALYLPANWKPGGNYPILVEFAGNGPYSNQFGDISTGKVEGSKLGYGITAGQDFIWICMPYLNNAGDANVTRWWGDPPTYNPTATLDYCKKTVPWICRQYGGDPKKVILAGFSRGAIACNYLGLHDDEIAKLWRAFIPYSHYDGAKIHWPYKGDDRASATERLKRLKGRPQFICHEGSRPMNTENLQQAKGFIESTGIQGDFTYLPTGFRNHNDAWTLRPSPARKALRHWLDRVLKEE